MSNDKPALLTAEQVAEMRENNKLTAPSIQGLAALLDSHEALRSRVAELTQERDQLAQTWRDSGAERFARIAQLEAQLVESDRLRVILTGRMDEFQAIWTKHNPTADFWPDVATAFDAVAAQLAGARELFQEMVHADESGELRESFPKLFALAALTPEAPKAEEPCTGCSESAIPVPP